MSDEQKITTTSSSSSSSSSSASTEANYRLPSDITLKHAVKLGIVEDKPIMLDYWSASLDKKSTYWCERKWRKVVGKVGR